MLRLNNLPWRSPSKFSSTWFVAFVVISKSARCWSAISSYFQYRDPTDQFSVGVFQSRYLLLQEDDGILGIYNFERDKYKWAINIPLLRLLSWPVALTKLYMWTLRGLSCRCRFSAIHLAAGMFVAGRNALPDRGSHSQPKGIFPFCRNSTSQCHRMAENWCTM